MVIIKFSDSCDWYYTNWIFRQLAQEVKEMFPDDTATNWAMFQAGNYGLLDFRSLDSTVATQLTIKLKTVAEAALSNTSTAVLADHVPDSGSKRQYRKAMKELLQCISLINSITYS